MSRLVDPERLAYHYSQIAAHLSEATPEEEMDCRDKLYEMLRCPTCEPEAFCPVCRQPVRASLYRESDPDAPCADCAESGGDQLIDEQ